MFDLHPSLLAALTGFISGFLLSVPVGPVNLTIINEGARRGLFWGLMIGAGAVLMEVIYCAIAFTGFASFFNGKVIKGALEIVSFVFMLYLGIKFLRVKTIKSIEAKAKSNAKCDSAKSHSAFVSGFVRVMGNPGVFLFWIVLAAAFKARDWVDATPAGVISCVAGVGAGTGLWFAGLAYAVSFGHRKFTEKTLLRMEHISGICLFALAFGQGVHIVWQMAHHKF